MKPQNLILCPVLLVALLVCGCAAPHFSSQKKYFSYRETPFRAEVRGTVGEVTFSAEIGTRKTGENGEPFEEYIRYITPTAAEGIVLNKRSDGTVFLQANDISATVSEEALQGWLFPLTVLLTPTEFERIEQNGKEINLHFSDGTCLTLSDEGIPLRGQTRHATLEVVWWESEIS